MDVNIMLGIGCISILCEKDVFKYLHDNFISDEKFNIENTADNVYIIESRSYKDLYFLIKNMEEDYKLDITLGM